MSFLAIFITYPYVAGLIGILLIGVGRLTRHRTSLAGARPARDDCHSSLRPGHRSREPFH